MEHLILHEDPISPNCYKIRLTASLLGLPIELRKYSILKGETRTPEFLTKVSPVGQIPVLQIGDSTLLPESGAACFYLAESTSSSLVPGDALKRAEMLRWMFWEQNQHEINIAVLRYWRHLVGVENLPEFKKAQIENKTEMGENCLDRMQDQLQESTSGWLVGDNVTLADICLYAYTHVAHDAGFDLKKWPAVDKWCKQMENQKGYIKF